jgi:hypothetical protein
VVASASQLQEVHDHPRASQQDHRRSLQAEGFLSGKNVFPNGDQPMVTLDIDPSARFDLASHGYRLLSGDKDAFLGERAIRFLQFKVWLLFPDEPDIVEAAGHHFAARLLRDHALKHAKWLGTGLGMRKNMSAKGLIGLLKMESYSSLYDVFFREKGWGILLDLRSPTELRKLISSRRLEAKTVCEMIDYRFRFLDHNGGLDQNGSISRSEFYRWYQHPDGKLSWRTIRQRWKNMRLSSALIYASNAFGFDYLTESRLEGDLRLWEHGMTDTDKKRFKRFIGISTYVANTLNSSVVEQLDELGIKSIRPKTVPFTVDQLRKMADYKSKLDEMRCS